MEKKKYILGILVSILVISIGVSFAYFATRTLLTGNGTNTQGTTVSLGDTTVNIEGSPDFSDTNIYPGHKTISKIKVTATGDKNVIYHLIWNGQNNLKTTLNYTVYKTTTEQNPSITCEKKEEGNITKIFYETCTESNFTNLGEAISSGEITPTTKDSTFKLVKNEELQATSTGTVVYYYIILEYPNKEESQNIDMNGAFIGTTTIQTLEKKEILTKDLILANNTIDTSRSSGYFPATFEEDTAGKIFSAEDDDGTTYFFAGSNPNNWVKFGKHADDIPDVYHGYYSSTSTSFAVYSTLEACESAGWYNVNCTLVSKAGKDIYWRIVRINGDESIRLIYNGPTTDQKGSTNIAITVGFSESNDDNAYVGYMYGKVGSSTYVETHTNNHDSRIKNHLYHWYNDNLKINYGQYIDIDAGFCGDRTVDNYEDGYIGDGSGTTKTQYAPMKRAYNTYTATYKCSNSNDYYTVRTSNKGNKALVNPIGLITSDEVMYAGGYSNYSTQNHWLNSGQDYWTMSPRNFDGDLTLGILVDEVGYLSSISVSTVRGVRPVINLRADALTKGSGTTSDPYRIAD